MFSSPATLGVAMLCCIATAAVTTEVSDAPPVGPKGPMEITTDTPAYCLKLLDRVSNLVKVSPNSAPQEVTTLATEGQRMCVQGQTRGGIIRLRRALVLMMTIDK
jgi:hypothetical protein